MSTHSAPILHVAALPFPSLQGTQAVIASMLTALAEAGRDVHLLCYPYEGYAASFPFEVHRATDFAHFRSLRSGPSLRKVLADAELSRALARLQERLRPAAIVAHHVEAAFAARSFSPRVFFAHTDLGLELPSYGPKLLGLLMGRAGATVDSKLAHDAHAIAAISPLLASNLRQRTPDDKIRCVLPPWPLPEAIEPGQHAELRKRTRERLRIAQDAFVWLYAGNLDGYQGWDELLRAVSIAQAALPTIVLLVGTASDTHPLWEEAERLGISARVRAQRIDNEHDRVMLHAAADAAIVPRRSPGGLPVKLLDALARGLPSVVTPSACADLPLADCVGLAKRDDGEALASALLQLVHAPEEERKAMSERGRRYVREHHGRERFIASFDAVIELALRRAKDTPAR